MWTKNGATQISNLNDLNTALRGLTPEITGISLDQLQVKGSNLAMLNAEIAANNHTLADGQKRAEILQALRAGLTARVNTHPITYTYDVHGEKHFPGGPAGTKFNTGKAVVNPFLVGLIAPHVGRIRRHANGKNQTYYLSTAPNQYTNGQQMAIQVDYVASPEGITYHGYPRAVTSYVLATALGGPAIPA